MMQLAKSPMISLVWLFLILSCNKISHSTINPNNRPTVPDTTGSMGSWQGYTEIVLGSGTGKSLTIDGQRLNIKERLRIRVHEGEYTSISIKNLEGSEEFPIIIQNKGIVTIKENISTTDIRNVIIAGDGEPKIKYGFNLEDISYRAFIMAGVMDNVTIRNLRFKNVDDYAICAANYGTNSSNLEYNGMNNTRTNNFKILHCEFDNTGIILFGGRIDKDTDKGFFKNVEIGYNVFKNSNAGSLCVFTNVQDYEIHHNRVSNVNQTNNNHNGIFYMQGNGTFHHNMLTNYQGNSIRMWTYSRGTKPSVVEIHNNICYNSRKYSGFEIQSFERYMIAGKTTYVNARVYNNTVGKLNTLEEWEGQLLDLYNLFGGSLEYYNNLGFDLHSESPSLTDMLHNMSPTAISINTNNHYFKTGTNAILDTVNFESKIPTVGAESLALGN